MVIHNGYWNYYLAFRIDDVPEFTIDATVTDDLPGLVAIVNDNGVLQKRLIEETLHARKQAMAECRKSLTGKETLEELYSLYNADKLPECFFDFDPVSDGDFLEARINDSIGYVQTAHQGYLQTLFAHGNHKSFNLVLMPIKLYYSERYYVYCPVYIRLFDNGNGVLKLSVPLNDILADAFCMFPQQPWYYQIKVWGDLVAPPGGNGYKIINCKLGGVQDIVQALIRCLENLFSQRLVMHERFVAFETFILSKCTYSNRELVHCDTKDTKFLRFLYNFARPDDFATLPDSEGLKQFWKEAHKNINGVHVVSGHPCRMLFYADVPDMIRRHNRTGEIPDSNDYFQTSISASFDHFISLALMQRDNEMLVYDTAFRDRHAINKAMVQYYDDSNYLERILISSPRHCITLYREVQKILNDTLDDFHDMLARLQYIETYEKTKLDEERTRLLDRLTMLFTVLFGLPLIYETLSVIKRAFFASSDIFSRFTVEHFSLVIWLGLVSYMIYDSVKDRRQYTGSGHKKAKVLMRKYQRYVDKARKRAEDDNKNSVSSKP